jgi:hypothetical protein
MRQEAGTSGWTQVPSPLQASVVQDLPSSQEYAVPPQTPAVQVSPCVHACPSSQVTPPSGVQAVWLTVGSQPSHAPPFRAPLA